MPKVYDLSKPLDWNKIDDVIYADTNIISPIFYDQAAAVPNQINVSNSRKYQQVLKDMFAVGIQIHISAIVILEMMNLFIKWDHKIYNRTQPNKIGDLKAYRELQSEMRSRSTRYPLIYKQITEASNIVLDDMRLYAKGLDRYINSMGIQSMDATDFMILGTVKSAKGILLTDDHDYGTRMCDCDLMTGNPVLVNQCVQCGFAVANPLDDEFKAEMT